MEGLYHGLDPDIPFNFPKAGGWENAVKQLQIIWEIHFFVIKEIKVPQGQKPCDNSNHFPPVKAVEPYQLNSGWSRILKCFNNVSLLHTICSNLIFLKCVRFFIMSSSNLNVNYVTFHYRHSV